MVDLLKRYFSILGIYGAFMMAGIPAAANAIDTSDGIFDSRIRTVTLRNPDNFMAPPVIRLATNDQLVLNFDVIGDTHEYFCYRLIHCNADWQPSRLLESEYIDGFNEGRIEDYAYSANTYVHYVNYNLLFPNEKLPILTAGNYLLQLYNEDDPDSILLQIRFSVTENRVKLQPEVSTRTDRGFNTEWQQVNLVIDCSGLENLNPYRDLIVTVMQNNRPETTRAVSHPLRVEGTTVIYEHEPDLVFPASNEYRRFETVRSDYPGMSVDSVVFSGSNWHAYLHTDCPRVSQNYLFDKTQHGRFKIDDYTATDPDLGADYVTVHFSLDYPELTDSDIYIDGDFTLHCFDLKNRMTYNRDSRLYEITIPLKQGSYNYQYVVLPKESGDISGHPSVPADASLIEGNFYETENEYLIKVFFCPPGSRGDRLVGYQIL